MTLREAFIISFGVWEEARPYLSLLVTEREMELIVGMAGREMAADEVAAQLRVEPAWAAEFLTECYGRCLVDKVVEAGVVRYRPAHFGERLDHFAKYENWDDIPAPARTAINRRFLAEFIAKHRPNVERKKRGLAAENALPNDTVMLLNEVEEMVEAATHIVVQPCDCRRLGQNCRRPVETCLWFDEGALAALDRGQGRRLTKAEAKTLLRRADKKGLMHTADGDWRTRGLHAICNCCACDCYPFRAAQVLESKGVWPRSRYVAAYSRDLCTFCGACVKRCHFEAFYHDGSTVEVDGRVRPAVFFDSDRCWGCGLCANACPASAIVMERLEGL
jgi:Pyruvate/2-oxoacid:ferredoxin oxidoreductase delta subunit